MKRCILPCGAFLAGLDCPCVEFGKWMIDAIGTNDMAAVLGLIRESRNAYDVMTSAHASGPEQMAALLRLRIALSPFASAKTVPPA